MTSRRPAVRSLLLSVLVLLPLAAAAAARAADVPGPPAPPPAAAEPAPTAERRALTRSRVAEEPYRLRADRLEGSATSEENVYTATHVTVEHGTTTVTGDSARIYRTRELVLFRGNVTIHDGTTVMKGDEASYDRKQRLAILRGNVRIYEGGARIVGREARFYRDENRSEITGYARMEDSTRTVTADRLIYDRNTDLVTAIGHVDAFDRSDSLRVQADSLRYDRRRDYAWASGNPKLTIEEAGGKNTVVRATRFEEDNARHQVYAIGDVRVDRDKLRAVGQRGEFYRDENRALLLGKPSAWDDQGHVQGDTLEIRFAGSRVQSLQVRPDAVVDYDAKPDSMGRGERNHAVGDTITLYLEGDEARRAWVIGHARSSYWPSTADSAQGGRNLSSGDSILVEFSGGRPQRATVLGQSQGTYYMAAEGDTSAAARREVVDYRGDRIVYDVNRGTVNILSHADVRYKEMRLTANQVRFNSRTQHLQAEGNPVLQDGKDRITGKTMTYDLNRRQGTVYQGRTTYERGFYYGEEIRRVSENELDVRNGSYTTCDDSIPHYHFGSARMKVYMRDKVVAKPVIFYIKRIPVLALPFYVFPIKPGRHSGFALPQVQFGSSTASGKFIRNLGYYWAISDYLDATGWADYYVQDRWVLHGQARYHKRYYWQGQLNGSFERQSATGATNWDLAGTHYQILGPQFSITAGGTLTNSSSILRDPFLGASVLQRVQRNLHSSVSVQKSWPSASLSVGLVRDQDLDPDPLGTRLSEQLPSVLVSLNARPIGHPARGREPAFLPWLSSTVWSFRSTALSQRQTIMKSQPDTTITNTVTAAGDTVQNVSAALHDSTSTVLTAARHDLSIRDTRTLFGFLKVSPAMSYSEVFYSRDAAGNRNQRAGVWTGSVGANTSAYGTFRPGLGPLRAVRHVITPSVSFVYQPPYPKLFYTDTAGVLRPRFAGVPGITLTSSEVRSLAFSLANNVHLKWGDPAKPTVINNFISMNTSASYDLLAARRARQLEERTGVRQAVRAWSNVSTSLVLRPLTRSEFSFSFLNNPYDGKLLNMSASTGFALSGKTRAPEEGTGSEEEPGGADVRAQSEIYTPTGVSGTNLPWTFSLAISYFGSASPIPGGTYTNWASSTRANGQLALNPSKNWRVTYGYQYDLRTRQMISQNYSVTRELHCWEMQFTHSNSGGVSEYYFKINVINLPEVYYEQGSRGLRGFGGAQSLF
jgi:lipopolysaccharide assembly outer membrane protein LptD (OstA)